MTIARRLAFAFLVIAPSWACASEITGKVVGVTDGDTVTVLDAEKTQHKIRLNGIDSPEGHQAFGQRSKQALSSKVFDKQVRVEWNEKDKYGRTVGDIFIDDRYINKEMVQEGWAWHYKKYSNSTELDSAEHEARLSRLGLWADANPIAPWDFRHPEVAAAATATIDGNEADDETATVYVTKTGAKYHRSGCRYLSKSMIAIPLKDAKARYSACSVCRPPQ